MELTVDSGCTYISATTPDTNILEDWFNGDLFNVQVSIFFNCSQVGTIALPNQYTFGQNTENCNVILGGDELTLNLDGILESRITSNTYTTSAGVLAVTPIDNLTFTVLLNSNVANYIEFEITDIDGFVYNIRVDFTAYGIAPCDIGSSITVLSLPELPCGVNFTEGVLEIFNEYFRADCNFPCIDEELVNSCTKYCDGIYTIQIEDEESCIFVNCSTACNVVDYFICNGGDIMVLLEALNVGSELASVGNTDCVTCDQLCEVFRKVQKLLGHTSKNILEDCGCNNN